MDFKNDFLGYNFTWFIGEVEDRNDPLKVGRVRVRCFGWHPSKEELPTTDLPWAQTIQPVTAPAAAPTGLGIGVWVFGFFMDGDKAQRPMIMGQIPGYRNNADGTVESELPRAARVEENYESAQSKLRKDSRVTGITLGASGGTTWDEPEEPDDKRYPYVQTVASEAGFMTETVFGPFDMDEDGGGSYDFLTRQVTYDCNGGYDERRSPSGDKIVKVIGDNYEIICGSSFVNIKGDINLTVDGSMRTNIAGDYELNVAGNMYTTVGKSEDKFIVGGQTLGMFGQRDIFVGGLDKLQVIGSSTQEITGTSTVKITGADIRAVGGTATHIYNGAFTTTAASGAFTLTSGSVSATTLTASGAITGLTVTAGAPGLQVGLTTHKHTALNVPPTPGT
jgi:hypothetical protein